MKWFLKVLNQYADFKERARRKEYWIFLLFNSFFSSIFFLIDKMTGQEFYLLSLLYGLAVLIPKIAVTVRRLHDVGKSGWMLLIGIIPLFGFIWLLVLLVKDGTPGENQYGPNPKESYVED